MKIAIDGPVGAGKSTIARAAAARLGYIYIDTGALYRAVGWFCIENGVDTDSPNAVAEAINSGLRLEIRLVDGIQHIYANGADVSGKIRTPEMSMMASKVSAIAEVRAFLLQLQRDMAESGDVIMDGRDIGTVVLPSAEVKIFLTASPEIRAKRRYDELIAKGESVHLEDVLSDLVKRDYDDSHREHAPLKMPEGAVLIDTSGMDFEASVEAVLRAAE